MHWTDSRHGRAGLSDALAIHTAWAWWVRNPFVAFLVIFLLNYFFLFYFINKNNQCNVCKYQYYLTIHTHMSEVEVYSVNKLTFWAMEKNVVGKKMSLPGCLLRGKPGRWSMCIFEDFPGPAAASSLFLLLLGTNSRWVWFWESFVLIKFFVRVLSRWHHRKHGLGFWGRWGDENGIGLLWKAVDTHLPTPYTPTPDSSISTPNVNDCTPVVQYLLLARIWYSRVYSHHFLPAISILLELIWLNMYMSLTLSN